MTETFSFGEKPILCHAWSPDGAQVAISQKSREIQILRRSVQNGAETFVLEHTLTEHTGKVLSLDWGKKTQRLLSAGADRNAFVWTFVDDEWRPMLVVLRLGRAATCVKWSPEENKFAVGSGDKTIAVCYHDQEQDFWVAKHIKKNIRSTITALDWHPNNVLIAAGCTDFQVRVFSGYIKEIEDKPSETVWGKKMPFANEMAALGADGWIHDVAFSPSGAKLAWVGHDSSVTVVDAAKDAASAQCIKNADLPFLCGLWVTEASLVVAGHDNCPVIFTHHDDGITQVEKLDIQEATTEQKGAMSMFKNMEKIGQKGEVSTKLNTIHQNTITGLQVVGGQEGIDKVSTIAKDGQMVVWNFRSLESSIAKLTIA